MDAAELQQYIAHYQSQQNTAMQNMAVQNIQGMHQLVPQYQHHPFPPFPQMPPPPQHMVGHTWVDPYNGNSARQAYDRIMLQHPELHEELQALCSLTESVIDVRNSPFADTGDEGSVFQIASRAWECQVTWLAKLSDMVHIELWRAHFGSLADTIKQKREAGFTPKPVPAGNTLLDPTLWAQKIAQQYQQHLQAGQAAHISQQQYGAAMQGMSQFSGLSNAIFTGNNTASGNLSP